MSTQNQFTVQRAKVEDIKDVRSMIQELADFEKMSEGPKLSEEDLIRDAGLKGEPEYCEIFVVKDNANGLNIGYAICYKCYSTWEGRCLFLEDIYIKPEHRKRGAGKRLFVEIAARAVELKCPRLDFHVLEWNPARKFYDSLGAQNLTAKEQWQMYRLEGQNLSKLAASL